MHATDRVKAGVNRKAQIRSAWESGQAAFVRCLPLPSGALCTADEPVGHAKTCRSCATNDRAKRSSVLCIAPWPVPDQPALS